MAVNATGTGISRRFRRPKCIPLSLSIIIILDTVYGDACACHRLCRYDAGHNGKDWSRGTFCVMHFAFDASRVPRYLFPSGRVQSAFEQVRIRHHNIHRRYTIYTPSSLLASSMSLQLAANADRQIPQLASWRSSCAFIFEEAVLYKLACSPGNFLVFPLQLFHFVLSCTDAVFCDPHNQLVVVLYYSSNLPPIHIPLRSIPPIDE